MADTRVATPTKNDVLEYVLENPSCTPADIYNKLGLNRGTARYHIRTLINEGKIATFRDGKFLRLFHNSSDYQKVADAISPCFKSINKKRILRCILDSSGITMDELSKKINLRKIAISRLVNYLVDKRIVSLEKDGKRITLFLTADAEKILQGLDF